MPQSPQVVARAFVDAINRHEVDALCGLMSADHHFIDSLGTVVQTQEKLRAAWAGYFHMVPDYTLTVYETFCEGHTVVMLGIAHGTYVRDGLQRPENFWQTPVAVRAHVRDDKVTEWRVYADNEPIRQLIAKSR
jgi:ketosteroid isomerase-like protein